VACDSHYNVNTHHLILQCAEDVKFEGAPADVTMYVHNDKCDGPVPTITEETV